MKPIRTNSPPLSPATTNETACAELAGAKASYESTDAPSANSLFAQDVLESTDGQAAQTPSVGSRFVEDFRSEKAMSISDESILEARAKRSASYSAVSVSKSVFLGIQKLFNGTVATLSAAVGSLMALAKNAMSRLKTPVETSSKSPLLPPIVPEKPMDWPLGWMDIDVALVEAGGSDARARHPYSPASLTNAALLGAKKLYSSTSATFAAASGSLMGVAHNAVDFLQKPLQTGKDSQASSPVLPEVASLYGTKKWADSVETLFDLAKESAVTPQGGTAKKPSRPGFGASSMPFSSSSANGEAQTPFYTPLVFSTAHTTNN